MKDILTGFAGVISQNDYNIPKTSLTPATFSTVLQVVFGIAGAIALLMITLGGFKYVLSQGTPQETAKAKDTILYALVGLIICVLAFAIVRFVVAKA